MHKVLNNSVEFFGERFITRTAHILEPRDINIELERQRLFSELFEQLMLFDRVYFKIGNNSTTLPILIQEFGINKVEENISNGLFQFLFWKPFILYRPGKLISSPVVKIAGDFSQDVYDDSEILGTEPVLVSNIAIQQKGYDPEKVVDNSFHYFSIHPDRKRILKKIVLDNTLVQTINDAEAAKNLAIDAYQNGKLNKNSLPFTKQPEMLSTVERIKLWEIANNYFEMSILTENGIDIYNGYNFFNTIRNNLNDLADSLKISGDAAKLFELQNIPNFKEMFYHNEVDLVDVFEMRELSNAKYFRRWINEKSRTVDGKEIAKEYLNEIKGDRKFFNTKGGKFLKTIGVFGIGAGLGAAISGLKGSLIGASTAAVIKDLGLNLLDTFWLDKILKGKNPSIYIENIEKFLEGKHSEL